MAFHPDNHTTLLQTAFSCAQQKSFVQAANFFTQNIKETCIQGLNFNKHGHSSVKLALLFLSSFLLQANAWLWRIHIPAVLYTIFDFGFGTISANVNPVKRPNNILVLLWKLFRLCGTPERVSGTPPWAFRLHFENSCNRLWITILGIWGSGMTFQTSVHNSG